MSDDVPIHFHTCISTMDITFTPALKTMIISALSTSHLDTATDLDAWFHVQFLNAQGAYNDL